MFQELQASGILLCYGPLALVLGGFIAFALMTDKIANRTYLRRLDPRPEAEHDGLPPYTVTQPLRALTPAGTIVTLLPEDVPITAVVPPAPEPAKIADADDLARLEGIGPQIKAVLHEAGITTFSQVAAMTPEALRTVLTEAGMTGIYDPTTWPQQAALAAQGNWAELEKLQDELQAGKRSE